MGDDDLQDDTRGREGPAEWQASSYSICEGDWT